MDKCKILDGLKLSGELRKNLKEKIQDFNKKTGITPALGFVMVGENQSGNAYKNQIKKGCEAADINFLPFTLPEDCRVEDYMLHVEQLNEDENIHGILLQFPLPERFIKDEVIDLINPWKDVDCIHPLNHGKINTGTPYFYPGTPLGIYRLLKMNNIKLESQHTVIIGSSNIVGKPLANMLLKEEVGSTVTVCHIKTKDLTKHTMMADIVVIAIGSPKFLKAHMIKEGAVVVDVGINFIPDDNSPSGQRMVGDVDFEEVKKKASAITPVPGGVGPMTVTTILYNTFEAAKKLL